MYTFIIGGLSDIITTQPHDLHTMLLQLLSGEVPQHVARLCMCTGDSHVICMWSWWSLNIGMGAHYNLKCSFRCMKLEQRSAV